MGCSGSSIQIDEESQKQKEKELKNQKSYFDKKYKIGDEEFKNEEENLEHVKNQKSNFDKKYKIVDEEFENEEEYLEHVKAQKENDKKLSKKGKKIRNLEKDFNKDMEKLRSSNPEEYVTNFKEFVDKYRDILSKQKIDLEDLDQNLRNSYGLNYIKKEMPVENKNVKEFIFDVVNIGLNFVKNNNKKRNKLDSLFNDYADKFRPVQKGITYSLTKGFDERFSLKTKHINNNLKFHEEFFGLEIITLVIYNEILESEKFFIEMAEVITCQKDLKTIVITIIPYENEGEFHNSAIYEEAVFRFLPILFNAIASHKNINTFYLSVFKNLDVRFSKSVMQSITSIIKKTNIFAIHLNKVPLDEEIIDALDLSNIKYLGIALYEPDMRLYFNLMKMIASHEYLKVCFLSGFGLDEEQMIELGENMDINKNIVLWDYVEELPD